jgi:hypothetical protein
MSGYRNSCWGRRAWKANYFLIWGVEEHMIPCLHFLPSNLFCLYFFCEWNTLENWIRFGRCSATSWNPLKHIRRGWRALRCSRTVPLVFTSLPNIWRTPRYLQLHGFLYFLMMLFVSKLTLACISSFVIGAGDAAELSSFLWSWLIEVHKLMDRVTPTAEMSSKLYIMPEL